MSRIDNISVIAQFVEVLEALDIPYAIGGSIASSVYGYVRYTQDADISVTPFTTKIRDFCDQLSEHFYLSEDDIRQAHQQAGSFNVIHFETAFKIDVFINTGNAFHDQILIRRRRLLLDESHTKAFQLVSPEDIVLLKLRWYKEGGGVSERQYSDIQGVLKTQRVLMDFGYMRQWSEKLGIRDLFENAVKQSDES